jgi:hypothetical protein
VETAALTTELSGYMKVARGHHGCGLIFYGIIPKILAGAPTTKDITKPRKFNDYITLFPLIKLK